MKKQLRHEKGHGSALKGTRYIRQYFQRCYKRWLGTHLAVRHLLLVAVGVLTLAGGALGNQLIRTFASSPCTTGDLVYTVVSGDTLSEIAARYSKSWSQLASYNHLSNANLIFTGQTLCIPQGAPATTGIAPANLKYVPVARQDALSAGISPTIFVRQINQESGFNPAAISPAGAVGIAQFLPSTAREVGVNPWDPIQSLVGAAHLMAQYVHTQYNGDYAKALAAYNAGPGTVQWAVVQGGSNWVSYLPAETKNYIRIILG